MARESTHRKGSVHQFRRPQQFGPQPWSNEELAELYRVAHILRSAGMDVETDAGLTDDGDPWFAFIHGESGDVVAHFARIDGVVHAVGLPAGRQFSAPDLRSVVNQMMREQPALLGAGGATPDAPIAPPLEGAVIKGVTDQPSGDELMKRLRAMPPTARGKIALDDVIQGSARWRLWGRLGWQDVLIRYRRSVLGPFWLTLSMGVMVGSLGTLYATILRVEMHGYLPFLTLGFLIWGFMSTTITEGCQCFIEGETFIRQIEMPLAVFVYRTVWRNLIILGHNSVIYIIVALIERVSPTWNSLLVIPGVLLMLLNATWIGFFFGLLSARFRDIPQIVGSLVQVVFFVTPIIWTPAQVVDRPALVLFNPIFHMIEVVRSPLLGNAPAHLSWAVAATVAIGGSIISFLLFRRFRSRIAYWV